MSYFTRSQLKYALILCSAVVLCLMYMELSGQNQSFDKTPIFSFMMFVAPLIVLYFGIKEKKKLQKNKLTFKAGTLEGFKISFIYALISPFIYLFYYLFINPGIVEYIRQSYRLTGYNDMVVIASDLVGQILTAIIFGTLYGAIASFFLKTKKSSI